MVKGDREGKDGYNTDAQAGSGKCKDITNIYMAEKNIRCGEGDKTREEKGKK